MITMNIHRVELIEIEQTEILEGTYDKYPSRKIVIKTEEGDHFELNLFAESPAFLEVTI